MTQKEAGGKLCDAPASGARCVFSVRASCCQRPRIRYRSANAATPLSKRTATSNPHGVSVGALAAALAHVPT
jgi:hypothetical protein